jgi:hypothetical protein
VLVLLTVWLFHSGLYVVFLFALELFSYVAFSAFPSRVAPVWQVSKMCTGNGDQLSVATSCVIHGSGLHACRGAWMMLIHVFVYEFAYIAFSMTMA